MLLLRGLHAATLLQEWCFKKPWDSGTSCDIATALVVIGLSGNISLLPEAMPSSTWRNGVGCTSLKMIPAGIEASAPV
jgi:hypothetical protein